MTQETHYCISCGRVLRRAAPAHPDDGGRGSGRCSQCAFEKITDLFNEE